MPIRGDSYSRFTDCFRRNSGMTPAAVRKQASGGLVKELADRLPEAPTEGGDGP